MNQQMRNQGGSQCENDEFSCACIHCKAVMEGVKKHGLVNVALVLQSFYDDIMKINEIEPAIKVDIAEIIGSIMKQIGHTGHIDKIVLKALGKEMKGLLYIHSEALHRCERILAMLNPDTRDT